ncbi:MAG: family NAD(P)-dependent oxidoreductase [Pseudonocardiales bacterium]|nr:family NAD(P)-dependent oxidoreductase [Pseudonocardiales bacterium]
MTEASPGARVALVTGASSGIGAATVRRFAARGHIVVAVARRAERLEKLAAEIAPSGGAVLPVAADITDGRQGRDCVARAVDEFGRLDIVVNNAGIMLLGPFESSPPENWERMLSLNLLSMLHITQEAIPHLRAAASGPRAVADVVNVGSVAGRVARANFAVYNATKFGVTAFSEALRQEVAPDGIRVGCVQPGAVDTELLDHVDPTVRERLLSGSLGVARPARAEDIAQTIDFLVGLDPGAAVNELVVRSARQPY